MSTKHKHKDRIGRNIEVGSIVCFPESTSMLGVGRVEKLNAKMINIKGIEQKRQYTSRKYPTEVVVISDIPETLMLLLKQQ